MTLSDSGVYTLLSFFMRRTIMRYHTEKTDHYTNLYGKIYICDHPIYNRCTLYEIGDTGLAVIQQRFDNLTKTTRWTEIDPWLVDSIYLNTNFRRYFEKRSGKKKNGLYPTVTVRQIMWALRMKPIQKERWETVFDRSNV